ncbi:hypothetical protein PV08_02211 [Exophiala spinifera]|uniref:L-ornithine N(5)-monooxygenase n=1 Tax=Exophiala spinifera TaxID=91928 RepID=A0A0D1Z1U7_9EURO|nr:uncharacterized protein PV08_02211 [Exophiala spinifera]KIW21631.1 hypothetical protein PV08_02211 [Exophiala spinifera]
MEHSTPSTSETLDLICIGFGVTALSLAVALHEKKSLDKALFLEAQSQSAWKPYPDVPSERLRTSFLNDLITSENPRSKFTFMNYLHATNRLIVYANSSRITPSRELFAEYLRWCGDNIHARKEFSRRVDRVVPVKNAAGRVSSWKVFFVDKVTGKTEVAEAKQVVVATEPEPRVPGILSQPNIRAAVAHSTDSLEAIPAVLKRTAGRARIAVIGDGQSAAEVFYYVQNIRGDHQTVWFTRDNVIRASDDSPFLQDVIRQPTTSATQALPAELRRQALGLKSTVVEDELLKNIYDSQYRQSVKQPDPFKWQHQIQVGQQLTSAEKTSGDKVVLGFLNSGGATQRTDIYDLVIAATGFIKVDHQTILHQLLELVEGPGISVDRDYQVNFRSGLLTKDCGIWLQGSLGEANNDDEAVYPTLAERSRRAVESILQQRRQQSQSSLEERSARL